MRSDVLIVGAGPSGLALALWLTKQGVGVRIIDQTSGPGTTSRAMAVQARTLELYRQLDLADAVVAAGHINPALNLWVKGKKTAHLSFADVGSTLTPYPFVLVYPQDEHERLLVARLAELGVTVERETVFVDAGDQGDHVVARLRTVAGDEFHAEARFLAACDGAKSLIRHQIGATFPGGTYDKTFYVADVRISGAAADGELHIALDTADFIALLAYGDAGEYRLIGMVDDPDGALAGTLGFDDVRHAAIAGMGFTVDAVNWFSTYRVHHRVTDRYRRGRVFLVGDAAHIHSPAGGQGMNTGIGDAINLAWKLAAVLQGRAPDALLDTYQAERRPFAEKLVDTTDRLFSFVTADGTFADFVRTRLAPLFAPIAYRLDPVREFMFRVVSQTQITYRDCAFNEGKAGAIAGGDRLPWVKLPGADNYASLAAIVWQVHVYGDARSELAAWCEAHRVPLHVFAWHEQYHAAGFGEGAAYLIRPDGHVALAMPQASGSALDDFVMRHALDIGR
jgi:2-polyprenyl-6-methoxyphenol hydroxylase-like FAD-dependent oxidoreductase